MKDAATIQPTSFWNAYKAQLQEKASAEAKRAYHSDFDWTPYAVDAAMRAMQGLGLKTQSEYFRLDAIGYESHGTHDWTLRVAFEHENRDHWTDELCKLCHVVADLRVLVSYWNFKGRKKLEPYLKRRLTNLENRIARVQGKWLFIFGPRCKSFGETYPFVAYEFDGKTLRQLDDDGRLNPHGWL